MKRPQVHPSTFCFLEPIDARSSAIFSTHNGVVILIAPAGTPPPFPSARVRLHLIVFQPVSPAMRPRRSGIPTCPAVQISSDTSHPLCEGSGLILTALAAILAFIPLTHSVFWGTLAYTLIGGTFAGTILTLVFLPAMYAIWFKIRPAPSQS